MSSDGSRQLVGVAAGSSSGSPPSANSLSACVWDEEEEEQHSDVRGAHSIASDEFGDSYPESLALLKRGWEVVSRKGGVSRPFAAADVPSPVNSGQVSAPSSIVGAGISVERWAYAPVGEAVDDVSSMMCDNDGCFCSKREECCTLRLSEPMNWY